MFQLGVCKNLQKIAFLTSFECLKKVLVLGVPIERILRHAHEIASNQTFLILIGWDKFSGRRPPSNQKFVYRMIIALQTLNFFYFMSSWNQGHIFCKRNMSQSQFIVQGILIFCGNSLQKMRDLQFSVQKTTRYKKRTCFQKVFFFLSQFQSRIYRYINFRVFAILIDKIGTIQSKKKLVKIFQKHFQLKKENSQKN